MDILIIGFKVWQTLQTVDFALSFKISGVVFHQHIHTKGFVIAFENMLNDTTFGSDMFNCWGGLSRGRG
jgi:hypothetical protein